MERVITIHLQVLDNETMQDILEMLELTLPYMADNVVVTSD